MSVHAYKLDDITFHHIVILVAVLTTANWIQWLRMGESPAGMVWIVAVQRIY
jgi:hypothetical protein